MGVQGGGVKTQLTNQLTHIPYKYTTDIPNPTASTEMHAAPATKLYAYIKRCMQTTTPHITNNGEKMERNPT
jgi:hypothetical protein